MLYKKNNGTGCLLICGKWLFNKTEFLEETFLLIRNCGFFLGGSSTSSAVKSGHRSMMKLKLRWLGWLLPLPGV